MRKGIVVGIVCAAGAALCGGSAFATQSLPSEAYIDLQRENFQKLVDDKQVDLYTIQNKRGMVVRITSYGAKIVYKFGVQK